MDHLRPVPPGAAAPAAVPGSGLPIPAPDDLTSLLRRAARGDETAFGEFYDATVAQAHGLALRVVRNPSHAQEVTQEAYLEVWRHGARFDASRGSARGWLLTIVHRAAVDRVRSTESATRREHAWEQQSVEAQAPASGTDQTAEAVEDALERRRVRAAVAGLTPVQREAVALAYFGGYTHTEVATMLEVPLGTAKTRIRDGLIRLRDALGVLR
ncbi:ECF RNA polymerase sigma factor SigK [Nocardioides yefusunii]|uniref:ECF RNA polymerase sigma factor SigK n=1 Tax=Nocardioides yefusunii TaxID=2500546 RepID=A0ABW1R1W8_9ACTN|nr:ECF RNA polymerase sigma factor SigK [Nocardioides yefusunii]